MRGEGCEEGHTPRRQHTWEATAVKNKGQKKKEREKIRAIRVKARAAGTRALPRPHFSGTLWGLQASPPLP